MALLAVGGLLWHQSVDLYLASNFGDPQLVALGGLFMVIGFAALHSWYGSKLALLCCLYIGGYEVYFIVSGTTAHEVLSKKEQVSQLSNHAWVEENSERAKAEYEKYKARFETPGEKGYQNGWFKKTYVDPAWKRYTDSQKQLQTTLMKIETQAKLDHTGWLKILYRLGLVFLMMLLTHLLMQQFPVKATWRNRTART